MFDSIYQFISSAKYLSIFILMAVLPNETVMPIVGFAAAQDQISLPGAIAAGTAGTTLSSTVVYFLARQVPDDLVEKLIHKYGRWFGITPKSTERAGRWFDRHARGAVFFCRFVPGLRTAISVPAGILRMPVLPFLAYTALGSAICCTLLAYAGHTARDRVQEISALITSISSLVYLLIATLIAAFLFWQLHLKNNRR